MSNVEGLNPHVVGRFFRVSDVIFGIPTAYVLIPMWWGGFSEATQNVLLPSRKGS